MEQKLLMQAISYVKAELSKTSAQSRTGVVTFDDLQGVFSDMEHALSQLETGDWEVNHWGRLQPKS